MKITPEMIDVGVDQLLEHTVNFDDPAEVVRRVFRAMSAVAEHTFELAEGPDKLMLHYRPESILGLAKTIEAAKSMGVADPLPEMLQTELYGSFK